ncbi:hypothetical protein LXL04_001975 [Taraxacum kok-saghyz]
MPGTVCYLHVYSPHVDKINHNKWNRSRVSSTGVTMTDGLGVEGLRNLFSITPSSQTGMKEALTGVKMSGYVKAITRSSEEPVTSRMQDNEAHDIENEIVRSKRKTEEHG